MMIWPLIFSPIFHGNNFSKLSIGRFGVCCLFTVSSTGSTINQNCTYLQNPGFPSTYTSTTSLTYTVAKCSDDVCSIRLDFETHTILGPGTTNEVDSTHKCQDSFTVTVS